MERMRHSGRDESGSCPRTAPPSPPHRAKAARRGPRGARRIAPVTADGSAPGGGVPNAAAALGCLGAAPFAATRFAVAVHFMDLHYLVVMLTLGPVGEHGLHRRPRKPLKPS